MPFHGHRSCRIESELYLLIIETHLRIIILIQEDSSAAFTRGRDSVLGLTKPLGAAAADQGTRRTRSKVNVMAVVTEKTTRVAYSLATHNATLDAIVPMQILVFKATKAGE